MNLLYPSDVVFGMVNPGFVCDVAITNSEASIKSNDLTNESSENFGGSNGQHGYGSPTRRIIWIIHMDM